MKCLSEINFRQAFVQFISYTAFLELHAKTRDNNALFSKLALIESDEGFCKHFRPDKAGLTEFSAKPDRLWCNKCQLGFLRAFWFNKPAFQIQFVSAQPNAQQKVAHLMIYPAYLHVTQKAKKWL